MLRYGFYISGSEYPFINRLYRNELSGSCSSESYMETSRLALLEALESLESGERVESAGFLRWRM